MKDHMQQNKATKTVDQIFPITFQKIMVTVRNTINLIDIWVKKIFILLF